MTIGQNLLPEFDIEMAGTRKVIERVPDDKLDWKIHEKSNTIGWVATHLANLPSWATMTIESDSLDVEPKDGEPFKMPSFDSASEIVSAFDQNVAQARSLLESVTDDELHKPWSLLKSGETVLTMPKIAVLRTWVVRFRRVMPSAGGTNLAPSGFYSATLFPTFAARQLSRIGPSRLNRGLTEKQASARSVQPPWLRSRQSPLPKKGSRRWVARGPVD